MSAKGQKRTYDTSIVGTIICCTEISEWKYIADEIALRIDTLNIKLTTMLQHADEIARVKVRNASLVFTSNIRDGYSFMVIDYDACALPYVCS
jgi:hypothetical protein